MPADASTEAVEHRFDRLIERQACLGAQLRRHANLGVHDTIGGKVDGTFVRHPLDRVAVLHDADGVGERLQVEHEVVAFCAAVEPRGQLVDIGRRQLGVAVLVGELDHRGGAQAPVEVVVQQSLRESLDVHAATPATWASERSGMSGERRSQFQSGYSAAAEMQCNE